MTTAINNAYIPDFNENKFKKLSIKIKSNIIIEVSENELEADTIINAQGKFLTPGFIDCHCHIESSLLPPAEFGNTIIPFGTLHLIADCHEITNIAGRKGLEFFMENAKHTDCNIKFAVPSSVPATPFATSGGKLSADEIVELLENDDVVAVGEIMNIPAAVNKDKEILKMINAAKKHKKRVNGHAPHLDKQTLNKYISIGIEDDHESETYQELKYKIQAGLKVFLREGTAEHTESEAYKILQEYPNDVMFCTDDKSINHILSTGQINYNFKKALKLGIDPLLALKAASYNGLKYYGLDKYAKIKEGNYASFLIFDNLEDEKPEKIYIHGNPFTVKETQYEIPEFIKESFKINIQKTVPEIKHNIVMKVSDGSLITKKIDKQDIDNDLLKLCNFERYGHGNSAAAYINGFNLKKGAIASSVSHDCHNILAVGVDDESILTVVNAIIKEKGGLALYDGKDTYVVPLHIGGIVSDENAEKLAKKLNILKEKVKNIGCDFQDAFATLSFMALEVIPEIKLTDKGLFDVTKFEYI